jgi:hypothetical protein
MSLTETIGNNVLLYPLWLLVTIFTCMIALMVVHMFLCGYKHTFLLHEPLAFCSMLLSLQYASATQGVNVAHLTVLVNAFAVIVNLRLLAIWAQSIERHIGERKAKIIRFIAYGWLLFFVPFSAIASVGAIYTDYSFKIFNDDCVDCTFVDATLIIWRITLGIAIAANLSQVCLTVILRLVLCLKDYEDKRKISSQLVCLFLLSLLLALNHFGILFEIPFLDIITFILFHIIFALTRCLITHFI